MDRDILILLQNFFLAAQKTKKQKNLYFYENASKKSEIRAKCGVCLLCSFTSANTSLITTLHEQTRLFLIGAPAGQQRLDFSNLKLLDVLAVLPPVTLSWWIRNLWLL